MGPVRRASAWLALGIVAGCASYQPQPISPADNAGAIETRSLGDPRLQEFIGASLSLQGNSGPAIYWDLEKLTLAALYYHPDLDIARAKLAGARARIVSARQVPNPTLDLASTYNNTTTVPSPWTVGLIVNFIVETFGKREYRGAQAEHLAEAVRDDLATATWQVRGRVRAALLDLWTAQRRLALSRQRLDRQEQLVRLIELRFTAGEASALDLARERINRNEVNLTVKEAERQSAESLAQLAQSVSIPLRALEAVQLSLNMFDEPLRLDADLSNGDLRHRALTGRSDVQGLLSEYAAMQSALQLQVSRQYPNLTLGPGYTYDQGDTKYDLSVGVELPVFNRNEGPIAEADARRAELAARFTALQAQIIGAIDAAGASLRASSRSVQTADVLLAEEQRRDDAVRRAFAAGQVDRPSLLISEVELLTAQLARVAVYSQYHRAVGLLEDGIQVPLLGLKGTLPLPERNPRIAEGSR